MLVATLDFHLSKYVKSLLFHCNFNSKDIHTNNSLINDGCKAWAHYAFKEPNSGFPHNIIWNNSYVKVNNEIVFVLSYDRILVIKNDILQPTGSFYSLSAMKRHRFLL